MPATDGILLNGEDDDVSSCSSAYVGGDPQGNDGMDNNMEVIPHYRFDDMDWEYCTDRPLDVKNNRIIRENDRLLIGLVDYMNTGGGVKYTLAQVTKIGEHEFIRNAPPFKYDLLTNVRESDTVFVPAAAPGEAPQIQATGRGKKRVRDSFSRAHVDETTMIKLSPNDEKGCALKWFVFVPRAEPATQHPAASQQVVQARAEPATHLAASDQVQVTTAALSLNKMQNATVEALARTDEFLHNQTIEARAGAICKRPCPRCKKYKSIDEWPSSPSEVLLTRLCCECSEEVFDPRCTMCNSAMDKDQWRSSKAAKCRGCTEKEKAKDLKQREVGFRKREKAKYEDQIGKLNETHGKKEPHQAKCWWGTTNGGTWKIITILSHPGVIKLYTKNGQGKKARENRDAVIGKDDRGRFVVVNVSRIWRDTQCRVWDPRVQKEGTLANRLTGTVQGHVRVRWSNNEENWESDRHVHSVVLDAPRKVAPPSRFSPGGKHNVLSSDLQAEHPSEQFADEFPRVADKESPLLESVFVNAVAKMAPLGEFSSISHTVEAAMNECKGSAKGKTKALFEDRETAHSIKELAEMSLLFLKIRGPRNEGEGEDGIVDPPLPGRLPAIEQALSALGPNYVNEHGLSQAIAKVGDIQRHLPSVEGTVFEHMYDGERFRNAKAIVEDHKRVREQGDSKRKTPPATSTYSTRSLVRSDADLYSWCFDVDAIGSKQEAACEKQKQGLCKASSAAKQIKLDGGGGKGKQPFKVCTWKEGCIKPPHSSSKGQLCRKHMNAAGEKVKMCVACGQRQSRRKGGLCSPCFENEHSSPAHSVCRHCSGYGYRKPAREYGGLCSGCTKHNKLKGKKGTK